jgi:hypothetical protein
VPKKQKNRPCAATKLSNYQNQKNIIVILKILFIIKVER